MIGQTPQLKVCENCFWATYNKDLKFIKCKKQPGIKGLLEVCDYFLKDTREDDKNGNE